MAQAPCLQRESPSTRSSKGLISRKVGVTGFEPAASSSRTKRSAKLSYTPVCADGHVRPVAEPAAASRSTPGRQRGSPPRLAPREWAGLASRGGGSYANDSPRATSRRGVRVAEGAALEMPCAGNRTGGSNPPLSVSGSSAESLAGDRLGARSVSDHNEAARGCPWAVSAHQALAGRGSVVSLRRHQIEVRHVIGSAAPVTRCTESGRGFA